MKIINYFGKEQLVYYEKLKNGLEIYILPNNNQANYHIEVVSKYGSSVKEFIPIGESDYIKLPLGVAHFLEHKTFDIDREDAFKFFSKTGTYVNAATNYFYTKYYIDGKKSIKKNLEYLLNMIFTPYYIPEKIESEKGIIAEEIKMYDDEADWIMDYESKSNIFYTTVNEKIAGTVNSIQKIDADILTKTYNTFYQPSNMLIVMTGNIKIDDVMEIIKGNKALNSRKSNYPIVVKKQDEPVIVRNEYKCIYENIVIPKLSYAYKLDIDTLNNDRILTRQYLSLIFSHLFGETSKFNEKVLEDNLATGFYLDHIFFDNIYVFSLEAESEYADLFKDEVDRTLKNISITEEDFERVKKIWISIVIRGLDNKENLAYSVVDDLVRDNTIFDQIELINRLNYEEMQDIISKLDLTNKSFVLMVPKE
jgi:predicted Zn-dependent peptidase